MHGKCITKLQACACMASVLRNCKPALYRTINMYDNDDKWRKLLPCVLRIETLDSEHVHAAFPGCSSRISSLCESRNHTFYLFPIVLAIGVVF